MLYLTLEQTFEYKLLKVEIIEDPVLSKKLAPASTKHETDRHRQFKKTLQELFKSKGYRTCYEERYGLNSRWDVLGTKKTGVKGETVIGECGNVGVRNENLVTGALNGLRYSAIEYYHLSYDGRLYIYTPGENFERFFKYLEEGNLSAWGILNNHYATLFS